MKANYLTKDYLNDLEFLNQNIFINLMHLHKVT